MPLLMRQEPREEGRTWPWWMIKRCVVLHRAEAEKDRETASSTSMDSPRFLEKPDDVDKEHLYSMQSTLISTYDVTPQANMRNWEAAICPSLGWRSYLQAQHVAREKALTFFSTP